ncbi:MAG: zinc ribbon domain-containing protein [Calditrichae bacterium]|nr:zinc ribbon domain-containing protein [Calditrichota bacterium]MCB9057642.1 zinc ribbon domain-containing protein [Calditrichia bacterium]
MPTYDYKCLNCGKEFEEFQKMSDPVLTVCPKCKKETLERKIGSGAGLLFKGNGFYITDYKNKKSEDSGKKTTTGNSTDSAKTEPPKKTEKKESAAKD